MSKVLVVIPAHNEAESIENVLNDIKKELKSADILVINDGSTDKTEKKVRSWNGPAKIINNIFNLGYAYSIQTGIKYAKKNGYDYVIQMDADGQHLASEAKKLLEAAEKRNADIILGSRYLKTSEYSSPLFRRFGTRIFEALIRIFCKKKIHDPLTGFQCLNRKTIEAYSEPGAYPEYPDAGLLIEMLMKGYRVIEVPVKMKARETGESMHAGFISPVKYMVTQFYSCVIIFIKYIGREHE